VKPTAPTANTSTPKTGIVAPLRGLLRVQGSGAPKTSRRLTLATLAALSAVTAALLLSAAPALAAPEAPVTGSAGVVTAASATLEGTLNPGASAKAGWYFFYSSEISCLIGQASTPQEPEVEGKALAEHVEVTGLQPSKIYRACMVATNQAGESTPSANEVTFTTPATAPTIESESVSSINAGGAHLEGTVNPNNETTECKFQYGTSDPSLTTGTTTTLCEPASFPAEFGGQGVSLDVGGLAAGKTYYYRVLATNKTGETQGTEVEPIKQFTTTTPFSEPPEAKPANPIAATEATLHGVLNPKSERTSEPGSAEFVYRQSPTECRGENEKQAGDEKTPAGAEGEAAEAKVTGLLPGTKYTFCVRVVNKAGEEAVSSSQTFTTPAVAPAVEEESVSDLAATSATLLAKINPGGANTTYRFEYGTGAEYKPVPGGEGYAGAGATGVVVSVHIGEGLTPSTTYRFRVVATSAVETVEGEEQSFTTQAAGGSPPAGGLPDGRVYEQVSPANKNGNVVETAPDTAYFGLAAEDGNAAVFIGTGAMGNATSSTVGDFVSRRSPSGWTTSSAIPPALGEVIFTSRPALTLVPSHDFSRFFFGSGAPYVSAQPPTLASAVNLFVSDNPAVEPAWVGQPTAQPPDFTPVPALGETHGNHSYLIAGGTPDLDTVYFTYSGTLIPQDASRAPHGGWGFYEWSHGTLREAGVLPNETLSPFGAVPAATAGLSSFDRDQGPPFDQAESLNNEVSVDGSRAFFVSPDPVAGLSECSAATPGGCTPELYVRETASGGAPMSVLVSGSKLTGHEGEMAPHGATFSYASPDGSHVFFTSTDRLTEAAPENTATKEYDFDVDAGSLTYLPGVTGSVIVTSRDGARAIVENGATNPASLDLWTRGAGGGQITPIVSMPGSSAIDSARASATGSAFVFRTAASLSGFNNGFEQVYRYDTEKGTLDCVSCPPVGVSPTGDARVSYDDAGTRPGGAFPNGDNANPMSTLDTRVISADGSRVFFDTPDSLVSQDTNGVRDVYEWENGKVSLISSGKGTEGSYVLDSSASGDDVFFTTAFGLVAGDRDNGYDVYDARVPRLGDSPPTPVPCQGDVCQGPPSVPSLLGMPASATFSGAGNLAPAPVFVVSKSKAKAKRCAKGKKRSRGKCVKNKGKRKKTKARKASTNRRASR
jgi:hypothetical protein